MVLTGRNIIDRMQRVDEPEARLVIIPLGRTRIEATSASVDVHLGQEFLFPRRTSAGYLDPSGEGVGGSSMDKMGAVGPDAWEGVLERVCVPIDGQFFLHPGQFAMASVYEFVKLPLDLCADVVGRSSWARVGLIVAMATFVHPGYAGCLTLELQNLGEVPLRLKPGLRVAQLIFREAQPIPHQPSSQLACAYGPEYVNVVREQDEKLLRSLENVCEPEQPKQ